ncbi:MAG: transglycosylase SLT domain-containing protein [Acidobacteria bacterium]|nr:transglycosylase SLT domain-containing protein [Acidobacteriota bacterium]
MSYPVRISLVALALAVAAGDLAGQRVVGDLPEPTAISTTTHAPLPSHPSFYWLVPDSALSSTSTRPAEESAAARFARGVRLIAQGDFAAALPLVRGADLSSTPLANYVRYYTGVALLGLQRFEEAEAAFDAIDDDAEGFLAEAAPLRMADAAQGRGDAGRAADILNDLSDDTLAAPEEVFLRLGSAYEAAGDPARALRAYSRVYYEVPLSTQALAAQQGIERLQAPALIPSNRFQLELDRAERLFAARRWAQARPAYAELASAARGDDRALIVLRLATCDDQLGRHRTARDAIRPLLDGGPREAEARYVHLSATRGLGDHTAYVSLVRGLVADHPDSPWAEEALDDLAAHYIRQDDEPAADGVLRELMRRFPRGRYTDRAAWRVGWRAYKQGEYGEAARTFEQAAAVFPRADYRPSWLYWAARSRDRLGSRDAATALYRIVAADYLNSYYGRLASAVLRERRAPPVAPILRTDTASAPAPVVPTDAVVRALVGLELYDAALDEVEYARKQWGDQPALQATAAWIRNRRGLQSGAAERFADVRGAITLMRRAYPHFMAAGGEQLPPEILRVIFPLDYWPLIRKYAQAHRLDPYLMAALISQESTFTPDIRSAANAVGLMQLIPATGRRYAAKLGIRFSTAVLTQPETNLRLGMRYFRDLMDRFGGAHVALAAYNAGEHRVSRWKAERPGFEQDEFIDDIPFQETQNYVKRILGTADDYRRLYGGVLTTTTATD